MYITVYPLHSEQHCEYELEEMDYAEFAKIAHEIANDPEETEDAIHKTFRMLDASNKGYITSADLREIMIKLGDPLTDEEVTAVIKEITKKDTDKITIDQFRKAFIQKQST